MRTLNSGTSELIPKKNRQKFLTLGPTFAILPFAHKSILTLLPSCDEYFGVYLSWWNHQTRFKMVHSDNAKPRVRQSQVCYLRITRY